MNSREINALVTNAAKRGRNVYAHAIDGSLIQRVVRARTVKGELQVRATNGTWLVVLPSVIFDAR